MIDALLNDKYALRVPVDRARQYLVDGGWETERLDAMHQHIGPGDRVFYVGAEQGEMPALCASWGAEVALFEPTPTMWPRMEAIWEENNLPTPWTWPGFVSDKDQFRAERASEVYGIQEYLEADFHLGWPRQAPIAGLHGFKELQHEADMYPQIRLDTAADMWGPPTVIAFDVEGSEWSVLLGALQTLHAYRPKLFGSIHPDFMRQSWAQDSDDFRDWIQRIGYRETILAHKHEIHVLYESVDTVFTGAEL